jgi:hypothetical protein
VREFLLAGLLVIVWALSWWGTRRFRIWFVLLAPLGAVVTIVLAFLSVPAGSCERGCVEGWADNVDGSEGVAGSLAALYASVVLAPITLIAELVLFLRRNPVARPSGDRPTGDSAPTRTPPDQEPADQAPAWTDLVRRPRR